MEDEVETEKQIKDNAAEDVGPSTPSPNAVEDIGALAWMECRGKKIRDVWK